MAFRCWAPLNGEEDDARVFHANTPEAAAEACVSRDWEGAERTSIHVRDADGVLHRFDIEARQETNFYVHRES